MIRQVVTKAIAGKNMALDALRMTLRHGIHHNALTSNMLRLNLNSSNLEKS